MFTSLGRLAVRRAWWVLGVAAALLAAAGVYGTSVFGSLADGGFEDPGSESARAVRVADEALGHRGTDVLLLYRSTRGLSVDDPAFRAGVEQHLADLPDDAVVAAATPWSTGSPALRSDDGSAAVAVLTLAGEDEAERSETYSAIRDELAVAPAGLTVERGGPSAVFADITSQVERDIARAEVLSLPVLLVLLVLVFGGLAAASLPLAVGGVAVLGAFAALRALTEVTDVSVFALNIVTMLGLGLAIDYALFVVSRFREELARGRAVEDAVVVTMATAGRTVLFSGLTVALSLASLLLFPQMFLRSMGLGGMAAVLIAALAAVTVLPAVLALLGHRVDALRVPGLHRLTGRAGARAAAGGGVWARIARSVMRRPLLYIAVTVPLLLALGAPFLRIEFGNVDARALPEGTESRVVGEVLDADFPGAGDSTATAVLRLPEGAGDDAVAQAATAWAEEAAAVDGVSAAAVTAVGDGVGTVEVRVPGDAQSEAARELLGELRALPQPDGAEVLVAGETAALVDLLASLGERLPWMAALVVLVTGALLFLAFGSLVLPVKAVVVNALSLTATFGLVVWVFQDGNLSGFLGFTPTGTIEATQPILMLAIAFGLSMDYEVFLLSRVREHWDATGDNALAVERGLQGTGRIITSAAVLIVVVIGAFSTSGITFVKMIGVGLAVAIVLDATVVRALLVPATMRLLGRATWWAPAPLERFWRRYGVRESDGDAGDVPSQRRPDALVDV